MARLIKIIVITCIAALLFVGCNDKKAADPLLMGLKITDLAPAGSGRKDRDQLLKTINFDIYVFQIPAENVSYLDTIWQNLYTRQIMFDNYDAFAANLFSAGLGQISTWDKIGNIIRRAGGKKTENISLLLTAGRGEEFSVAQLHEPKTIFHVPSEGSMKETAVGSGKLALRINAEKIPTRRGVCHAEFMPVYLSPPLSSIPQLAARLKPSEMSFSSLAFNIKMGPGDFIFLGPAEYISDQITLGGLFFYSPGPKPAFRAYLIVCTWIGD